MPMSFVGRAANSSGVAIRRKAPELGSLGSAARLQRSSLIGSYVMATAEHREPCESRGSRTVLGARGGEIPPRDSTFRRKDFWFRGLWRKPGQRFAVCGGNPAWQLRAGER